MPDRVVLKIPSDSQYIEMVYAVASEVCRRLNFGERERHDIMVSVSEGYTNAVVHGNQRDRARYVTVSFENNHSFLSISVEDEGVLPIKKDVGIETNVPDRFDETGRGLMLIRRLAGFSQLAGKASGGNILTMKFQFDSDRKEVGEVSTRRK